MFNFVVDRTIGDYVYPALANWEAMPGTPAWQEFVKHRPYTVPCELIEHCKEYKFPYCLYTLDDEYPDNSYYPVGVGFFDFSVDYFSLMSDQLHVALKQKKLRVLFYYHEGDNPYKIKNRLEGLCETWQLPVDCYQFVSGNTASRYIDGFIYFADHELLYGRRNSEVLPTPIHHKQREKEFTVLSRTHKWWRATAMADLHRNKVLENSYWSYRTDINIADEDEDLNPIEVDQLNIHYYLHDFLKGAPYVCDNLTSEQHNDHSLIETDHFANSYCQIILETLYDADRSEGAFLSEKTFKAIKHGQPFVIVGTAESLDTLRLLGYRTFDHAIDNSYDGVLDNTERWRKTFQAINKIQRSDMHQWFERCREDAEYNQALFQRVKHTRLNILLKDLRENDKLIHKLATTRRSYSRTGL